MQSTLIFHCKRAKSICRKNCSLFHTYTAYALINVLGILETFSLSDTDFFYHLRSKCLCFLKRSLQDDKCRHNHVYLIAEHQEFLLPFFHCAVMGKKRWCISPILNAIPEAQFFVFQIQSDLAAINPSTEEKHLQCTSFILGLLRSTFFLFLLLQGCIYVGWYNHSFIDKSNILRFLE